MPADLDQFRCQNSHGAVIGRKGFVQLGHMPTDTGPFFNQIHFKPGGGKVQGGLNTTDSATNHQYIAKFLVTYGDGNLFKNFCRH